MVRFALILRRLRRGFAGVRAANACADSGVGIRRRHSRRERARAISLRRLPSSGREEPHDAHLLPAFDAGELGEHRQAHDQPQPRQGRAGAGERDREVPRRQPRTCAIGGEDRCVRVGAAACGSRVRARQRDGRRLLVVPFDWARDERAAHEAGVGTAARDAPRVLPAASTANP